jgi:hypothetical protein
MSGWEEPDLERDAGFVASIDGEIERVVAGLFEFELLNIDDEISGKKISVGWELDIGGQFDAGHDRATIFIDQVHANAVRAFLDAAEHEAKRDGALGMNGGQLMSDDGVEAAEQVEFAAIVSGSVAEHSDLNIHRMNPHGGVLARLRWIK